MLNQINEHISPKRIIKLLSIFAFLFIELALTIIATTPPASSYELSIYDSYPWYFWLSIIISITLSISIIIFSSISKNNNNWKYGLLSLIISYFIFLLLPYFRGYALYWRGGDVLDHIGWSNAIISTGHTTVGDYYPVIHILITDFRFFGISSETTVMFLPAFFTILYLMFVLLLSKGISKNFNQSLFILAFSTPLLFSYFHLTIHPAILSIYMVPLLLYCLYKETSSGKKIELNFLFMIFSFLIVFFHPTTTIILILILIFFMLSNFIKKRIYLTKSNKNNINIYITIIFVSFFTMLFTYSNLLIYVKEIINWFIYGDVSSIFSSSFQTLGKANLQLIQILSLFINLYGPIMIYFIVALVCLFFTIKQIRKKTVERLEIDYGVQLIGGIIIGIIFFIGYFIEQEPIRVIRYFILIAPLFIGIVFYSIFNKLKNGSKRKITFVFMIFLIINSAGILALFNVYSSPITANQNQQITQMDIKGISWFLDKGDVRIPLMASFLNLQKFENYMRNDIGNFQSRYQIKGNIPSHFGYEKNETLTKTFQYASTYMITDEFSSQFYLAYPANVRDKIEQYLSEDFNKLNNDSTVLKSYSNGEFVVWLTS